jgi:hypothetical protein
MRRNKQLPSPFVFFVLEGKTMNLPRIYTYGNYRSDNYGAHCLAVEFGELTLFFSYRTIVGFHNPQTGYVVSENCWGPTTGKHLNAIAGRGQERIPRDAFLGRLRDVLSTYNVHVDTETITV